MLPIEAFAEAVAFLRLHDLSAPVFASASCSSLASKASKKIRWEEFPGLDIYVRYCGIHIFRDSDIQLVADLTFPSESEMAQFVAAAFPNCFFEGMFFSNFVTEHVFDAIGRVADSVVVKGPLRIPCTMRLDNSLRFVQKFRNVKALRLDRPVSDEEVNEVANFCRRRGIRELYTNGLQTGKLALF